MPYTLAQRRWASGISVLSFVIILVKIVLLGVYAPHEVQISVTREVGPKTNPYTHVNTAVVSITFIVFSFVVDICIVIGCLLIVNNSELGRSCTFTYIDPGTTYYGRRDCNCYGWWCYVILAIPVLTTLIVSLDMNVKYFGWLPTTPLQGVVFMYAVIFLGGGALVVSLMLLYGLCRVLGVRPRTCLEVWCPAQNNAPPLVVAGAGLPV